MSSLPLSPKRVKDYRKYSSSLKREVARRYLAGEFSYRIAAEEYGLDNKDVVKEFVRWYRKQLVNDQTAIADSLSHESPPSQPDLSANSKADLEKEIVRLRKIAHEAEVKAEAWRTLVHNASELTGTDLIKKFAPKPSKK